MSQISTASPITASLMGQITQGRAQKEQVRSNMAREAIAGQEANIAQQRADMERQRFPLEQARLQAQIDAQKTSADLARERMNLERDQFQAGLEQSELDRELKRELSDKERQRYKDYQDFQREEGALDRDHQKELAALKFEQETKRQEEAISRMFEMELLKGDQEAAGRRAQTERTLLQTEHNFRLTEATKGRNAALSNLRESLTDFSEAYMEDAALDQAHQLRMKEILGGTGDLGEVAVAYDDRTVFGLIPYGEQTLGAAAEMDFYEVAKKSGMSAFEAQSLAEGAERAMAGMVGDSEKGEALTEFLQSRGISVDEDDLISMGVSESVAERVSKTASGSPSAGELGGEAVDRYQKRDQAMVMDRFLVRIAKGMAAEEGFVGTEHQGLLYQAMSEVVSGGTLSAETAEKVKAAGIGAVVVNTLKAARGALSEVGEQDSSIEIEGVERDKGASQAREIQRSFRDYFSESLGNGLAALTGSGTAASIGYISADSMEDVIGELTRGVRSEVSEDELVEILTQIPDGASKDQLLSIILEYGDVPVVESEQMTEDLLRDLAEVDEREDEERRNLVESLRDRMGGGS